MASGAHLDLASFNSHGLTNSVTNDIVFHTIGASQKIHLASGSNIPAKLTITSNNIGINNINPSYDLDITGLINISSNLYIQFGRIGIGSTNPKTSIHINSNDAIIIPVGSSGERPLIGTNGMVRYNTTTLQYEGFTNNNWIGLGGVIDVNQDTKIIAETVPGANNDQLKFYTSNIFAMIIDSNQRIGIGSTNPKTSIHINSNDAIIIPVGSSGERPLIGTNGMVRYNTTTLQYEGFTNNNWTGLGGVIDVNQDTKITAETVPGANNDQLKFYTSNILAMIIDSNQRIGIGSTSPEYSLDIGGSCNLRTMNFTSPSIFIGNNNDMFTNFSVVSGTDLYYTSGNIGIGTTSPQAVLDINGITGNKLLGINGQFIYGFKICDPQILLSSSAVTPTYYLTTNTGFIANSIKTLIQYTVQLYNNSPTNYQTYEIGISTLNINTVTTTNTTYISSDNNGTASLGSSSLISKNLYTGNALVTLQISDIGKTFYPCLKMTGNSSGTVTWYYNILTCIVLNI